MKNILVLVAVVIATAGCKQRVKIINGELPEGMAPYASKFLGEYAGDLDGRPMHLMLSMVGKKVVLTSTADWIDQGCASTVSDLKEIYVKNKKNQPVLTKAVFYFDAGQCSNHVWGRELEMVFKDKGSISAKVSVFARSETYWSCTGPHPYPYAETLNQSIEPTYIPGYPYPYPYPSHPYDNCRNYIDSYFLDGRFEKIQ